jgi:hypothetical protein
MKNIISIIIFFLPLLTLSQSYIVNEYKPKTDSLLIYFDTDTSVSNYYFGIPSCEIKCDETTIISSISTILCEKSPCVQKEKIVGGNCFRGDTIIYGFSQYNGKLEGNYIIRYPSKRMWIKYIYRKDKIIDIVEHYYDHNCSKPKIKGIESSLMALVELDEEGRLKNIKEQYTLSGKKLKKGTFKDGDGTILFYRADGSLLRSIEMKNGIPHGECIYYYQTGQILASGKFNEGLFVDIWNEFSPLGEILATTNFKQ